MHRGYVKLWRKTLDNPYMRKPDVLVLWVTLLMLSNHKERDELLGGKRIKCKPGQFTTGRKQLSEETGISEYKVQRILKLLESEQQIAQQTTSVNRLITITNWVKYQNDAQQNAQRLHNDCTTSAQQVHTPKECKNDKNVRRKKECVKFTPPQLLEVKEFCKVNNYYIDCEQFVNFYESKGWMVGKNKMKDWKAAVRTWIKREPSKPQSRKPVKDETAEKRKKWDEELKKMTPEQKEEAEKNRLLLKSLTVNIGGVAV